MMTTVELPGSLAVDSLLIQVATDKSKDPYGQDGFSVLEARGRTTDVAVIRRAEEMKASQSVLTVTCAKLRVKGTLSAISPSESPEEWVLHVSVHEISYRKATGPRVTWKRT